MSKVPPRKAWLGDTMCNVCLKTIRHKLYDARVSRMGTWATMCEACFRRSGAGLGEGRGQEYTQKGERFYKTAG
jgi:hypothetical protein